MVKNKAVRCGELLFAGVLQLHCAVSTLAFGSVKFRYAIVAHYWQAVNENIQAAIVAEHGGLFGVGYFCWRLVNVYNVLQSGAYHVIGYYGANGNTYHERSKYKRE